MHTHEVPAGHTHHTHWHPSGPAQPAVLELGADVGAAVIYTTAALDGQEIQIKPSAGDWSGAHTAVRRRPGAHGGDPVFAALYFGLAAGAYDLRLGDESRSLEVVGGQVTEQTW